MEFVTTGNILKLNNVIMLRKIIYNNEMDDIIIKMKDYISSFGALVTRIVTITKGINFETGKQRIDMEFLIESNQPIKGNNIYRYIPEYVLEDAVKSTYIGLANNANMATREVQEYIKKHELNPIGPTHQVINIDLKKEKKREKNEKKKKDIKNDTSINMEVYVKVS